MDIADEESPNTYVIRPAYEAKFKPREVGALVHEVVKAHLNDKTYDTTEALGWAQAISDDVKEKCKGLGLERYKIVVQSVIGEQRGEGAKMAARCIWDADTDNCAQDVFQNESLFCVTAAYGVYFY